MLLLNGANVLLRVVTGSAADIRAAVSYVDNNAGTLTPGPAANPTAIVTATTTTIVAAPGASLNRNLKYVALANAHASVSSLVAVELFDGTTAVPIAKATLLTGETLTMDSEGHWEHRDVNGAEYTPSRLLDVRKRLAADQTFATAASFADITDLNAPLLSGRKYNFEAHLYHINNATTTGSQFAVNIGAAPTVLQVATIDTVTASVTASVHSAGAVAARDTAITAQTTGSLAITMAIISGYIQPSADGTFAIRATSEVTVASGLIVKAGSWMRIWETDN